jgi:hypothetical protein
MSSSESLAVFYYLFPICLIFYLKYVHTEELGTPYPEGMNMKACIHADVYDVPKIHMFRKALPLVDA